MNTTALRYLLAALAAASTAAAAFDVCLVSTSGSVIATAEAAGEHATRYHCPMHPTIVSDHPGDCPICGMRLVPIEEEPPPQAERAPSSAPATAVPTKKTVYRSTMNPSEFSDQPGKDSMGMDMVPEEVAVTPTGSEAVEGRVPVQLSDNKRQLIGVRTAPVTKQPLIREVRTVGRVTYDETRLHHVHTKISGWLEELYANATGEYVKQGDPLLTIYSPELVASAQEYLLALQAKAKLGTSTVPSVRRSAEVLVSSARQRLLLYDLTPQQIEALESDGEVPTTMTLYAPISGHVIARNVTQGEQIDSGRNLLDIADLSRVWVLADIYEYEVPFVHLRQKATMNLTYLPGRTFDGEVTLIYPVLNEQTRTVKARLEFANSDFNLKPEMYAEVVIASDMGERTAVPANAVINSGAHDLVFVQRADGSLEPREVKLGVRLPDTFEVLGGVGVGETVVTSGNFLVDSESKLKAALAASMVDKTDAAPH